MDSRQRGIAMTTHANLNAPIWTKHFVPTSILKFGSDGTRTYEHIPSRRPSIKEIRKDAEKTIKEAIIKCW